MAAGVMEQRTRPTQATYLLTGADDNAWPAPLRWERSKNFGKINKVNKNLCDESWVIAIFIGLLLDTTITKPNLRTLMPIPHL